MALGYDGKLYILAFDHRGSFLKKWFGITGDPTPEESQRVTDAKSVIFDGMVIAAEAGEESSVMGVLVDEQFGGDVPAGARKHGLQLAMPVERSGQELFDFEYDEEFGDHISSFDPDFSKVLVRYNPDGDAESNVLQLQRLKVLSDWLRAHDRKFLFELLVPATDDQLASVGGDTDRYDAELRPDLMISVIAEVQQAAIEVDVWKIEGVQTTADCARIAEATRAGGRDGVKCVLLGRGAKDEQVDHWLRQAAPVDGFVGFAIGRSIWSEALTGYLDGSLEREAAAAKVAEKYTRFIEVYRAAE